jgi:hypothetical protein
MISYWECGVCEMLFTSKEKVNEHKCKGKRVEWQGE